jgi:hypothetical protein
MYEDERLGPRNPRAPVPARIRTNAIHTHLSPVNRLAERVKLMDEIGIEKQFVVRDSKPSTPPMRSFQGDLKCGADWMWTSLRSRISRPPRWSRPFGQLFRRMGIIDDK